MLIASYRHTERGIKAAQLKPLSNIVHFPQPKRKPLIVPDNSLMSVFDAKFEKYIAAVQAEYSARWRAIKQKRYRARFDVIARRICAVFKVSFHELYSERRNRSAVYARQAICYWARRLTALSTPEIGRRMGGRDHTTILFGVSAYQRKRARMGRNLRKLRKDGI